MIDWCILTGQCKPQQIDSKTGSQQEFMSYCRKFFNRQLSSTTTKSKPKRRSAGKSKVKRTTVKARKSSPSRQRAARKQRARPTTPTRGRQPP